VQALDQAMIWSVFLLCVLLSSVGWWFGMVPGAIWLVLVVGGLLTAQLAAKRTSLTAFNVVEGAWNGATECLLLREEQTLLNGARTSACSHEATSPKWRRSDLHSSKHLI